MSQVHQLYEGAAPNRWSERAPELKTGYQSDFHPIITFILLEINSSLQSRFYVLNTFVPVSESNDSQRVWLDQW